MVILITGASHTGKTALAQRLIGQYGYACLSIDHLKMGLIRSGRTTLTPTDSDEALTALLWPIVREMIKTAIENEQHLIVEGCYVPMDWRNDFAEEYLRHIRFRCLVMTERYLREHFADVLAYASVVEKRMDDGDCSMEGLIADNARYLALARQHDCEYILIDHEYRFDAGL